MYVWSKQIVITLLVLFGFLEIVFNLQKSYLNTCSANLQKTSKRRLKWYPGTPWGPFRARGSLFHLFKLINESFERRKIQPKALTAPASICVWSSLT